MNIKSLLLGSAAALVAVSGARAADAVVVAEPEPMEYVRVCDVYGAGYYYIPGTETCLRVGGYLRYDIGVGKGGYGGLIDVADKMGDGLNDTYYKRARAALQLDARSETELGTLRAYMHINFDWNAGVTDSNLTSTGTNVGINHAYIELGGFRVGKTDSLFATMTGYTGNVIQDDLISYAGGAGADYGTHQIAYTYVGSNGFSAAVAVEEGAYDNAIDSYVPHVVAGAAFTQGWGGVSGVVGYDSNYEEWAGKLRLDVNVNEQLSLFVMGGYGTDDNVTRNFYKGWGGNWAVWGGGTYRFNEKASFNAQVAYAENKDVAVVANVAYQLVPGLTITPEVAWNSWHTENKVKIDDGFGGFLRFQRSF
ncbi:porin [Pseudaminobacter salicylatoxidans]|uniref:porin n=1 Tax=Pseudaminobacter salicylatoxidans TaxID=93369 RepID=UPI0002EF1968|nr:porin [Pseudaminobacter salicylatoxidans]